MTFALIRSTPIPSLGLTAQHYRHACGMEHWHLASDQAHRGCLVSVRTPPDDDTGKPHILEHTVLCGSAKYPVRDPFFAMLRRSLQTFMNAMTYPDHTVYPFSTQVPKDFAQLLNVYLDCTFAPTLSALDFAQEGHRIEATPAGGWQRAGVVFNEMKGAYDEPGERVSTAISAALFPDTCARFNYGGDPDAIPQLTHDGLRAAHHRWYAPANAVIVTSGDMDPLEIQYALTPYLRNPGQALAVPGLQSARGESAIVVPVPPGEDPVDAAQAGMTWVWGDAADLDHLLDGEVFERVLLGHAGSPLRRALETSGLGRTIGSSGLHTPHRHAIFTVELAGIAAGSAEKVRALIEQTLTTIAASSIPEQEIHSALHQVELSRRELGGDHFPWPLELCFRVVPAWTYGVDPLPFLDQTAALVRLEQRARQPGYINRMVTALLANRHRVWAEAVPDGTLAAREAERGDAALARDLAAADVAVLQSADAALRAHQLRKDDPEVLPTLTRLDIPAQRQWTELSNDHGVWRPKHEAAANGIIHHLAVWELPELSDDEVDLLPSAVGTLSQMGVGDRDYAAQAAHVTSVSGGLGAWLEWTADAASPLPRGRIGAEIKGLTSRAPAVCELLSETALGIRHDEHERLSELLDQSIQRMQERVSGAGQRFAALAAARGLGGLRGHLHRHGGLGRLTWLRATATGDIAALGHRINTLWRRIIASAPQVALLGSGADQSALIHQVGQRWSGESRAAHRQLLAEVRRCEPTAFTTPGQVGHVAMAFAAPAFTDPDAAALAVGCQLLSQQVLHPRIRERGGAYGARAGYDSGSAMVTMASYRDPRLAGTLDDMRAGLEWLMTCPADARAVDEAVLSVVSDIDTPASPVGEARARFLGHTRELSVEQLQAWRSAVVACTVDQIRTAARRWLQPNQAGIAAVCPASFLTRDTLNWPQIAV